MKHIKAFILFLTVCLLLPVIAGCASLSNEKVIIDSMESLYPNAEVQDVILGKTNQDEDIKTYTFNNGDFEFHTTNYIYRDATGFASERHSTDYYEKLYLYKKDEILTFINNAPMKVMCITHTADLEEPDMDDIYEFHNKNWFKCKISMPDSNGYRNQFKFEFHLNEGSQIQECLDFLEGLYDIVEAYIPNNTVTFCAPIDIEFYLKNEKLYLHDSYLSRESFSLKSLSVWVNYSYASWVKQGKVFDFAVNEDEVKHAKLTNLIIDGQPITSNNFDICFVYNPEDNQYYTPVSFGTTRSMGKPSDYLQREIISSFYPNSNYKIGKTKCTTTYKINKDKFVVKWEEAHEKPAAWQDREYMSFYKNGENLHIDNYASIGMNTVATSNVRYISVDNFAMLMNMEVTEINQNTQTVHLQTK